MLNQFGSSGTRSRVIQNFFRCIFLLTDFTPLGLTGLLEQNIP